MTENSTDSQQLPVTEQPDQSTEQVKAADLLSDPDTVLIEADMLEWTADDVLDRVLKIGNDYLLSKDTRLGAIHALTQVYKDWTAEQARAKSNLAPLCNHPRLLPSYPCKECSTRDPRKARFGSPNPDWHA